ncbi:MAG: transposase domain-containing protein [Deltaproteobacteria bacterium]|nr:transposase domain-containing protein [Deltaproteobacteria bacterium]
MARTAASLNKAARVTNYISLGVIASAFPAQAISAVLIRSGKGTVRERELPA